jgi:hypothetical protein
MVPPQEGELVYITDSEQLYIGDGNTLLGALDPVTGYTAENAIDDIGAALTSGVHQNITFTYTEEGAQDLANRIDATVGPNVIFTDITATGNTVLANTTINGPLTVTGKLIANFNGSIFADDSTLLVDGVDNKINLDGTVKGDIIPNISEVYDIGSPSLKFKDLYLSGTSLYLGAAQVTASGSAINLPVGSTVGGVAIMSGDEAVLTDIQGSVFGDDSTLLLDGITNEARISAIYGTGGAVLQSNTGSMLTPVVLGSANESSGLYIYATNTAPGGPEGSLVISGASQGTLQGSRIVYETTGSTGTSQSPTNIQAGDAIGSLEFRGLINDTEYYQTALLVSEAITIGASAIQGNIFTAVNDSSGGVKRFNMASNGAFNSLSAIFGVAGDLGTPGLSNIPADVALDVRGITKLEIRTAPPASPVDGMITIQDGATWDPAGTGVQAVVAYINGAWARLN